MKVELIIALGYSGYEKDKEIAKEVPGIDVVVGARSKTFLAKENIYDYYTANIWYGNGYRIFLCSRFLAIFLL